MSLKVGEVMNRHVITIREDASILDALHLMLDARISGLPVIANDGSLAGMLTEGDFLRRSELGTAPHHPRWLEFMLGPGRLAKEYVDTHGNKVAEVMTPGVVSIDEDALLPQAVRLMEQRRIKRLPVLRNGQLVGILSRADLLRAFVSAVSADMENMSDEAIRRRITDEIGRQAWSPHAMITVIVANGIVQLRGLLFDDRLRSALHVLVENVPGVKQIQDRIATIEPMTGYVVQGPGE